MPTSNKKRWIESLIFIAVVFLVLKVASYILDPIRLNLQGNVEAREASIVSAFSEPEDTIDVAIIGDSEALVVFNPQKAYDEAGISSYVLGEPGQSVSGAYYLINDLLEKQHPEVIIMETNIVCDGAVPLKEHNEFKNILEMLTYQVFPVFRYHGIWKAALGLEEKKEPTNYRGYNARSDVIPYTGGEYMFESDEVTKLPLLREYYLKKTEELCKENDISLIYVSSINPLSHEMNDHNYLVKHCEDSGLEYIDFNMLMQEIGFDFATDSLDGGDHVNSNGTDKITGYLINYLNENYDLEDTRGETE